MNPFGRRIVRSLAVLSAAVAVAMPASAGAAPSARANHVKAKDGKSFTSGKRPAGTGSGRRIR
jgi:uncharacterized membrane protein